MREPADVPLQRGDTVARYVVMRRIGSGGIGVVFRAFDPDLDRQVALKLVPPRGPADRARVLREAQAMARLSHPNVVGIYDVIDTQGGIAIAMELNDGQDVDAWLERPRTLREILQVFGDCARGLAAAHEAGLCHRDCKPSNFLLSAQGVGKVADFGLASPAGQTPDGGADVLRRDRMRAVDARGRLSQDGAVMGTPDYLAPEVEAGGSATPKSDQYAFCLSLREALRRSGLHAPRPLRRLLRRGLQADPQARYADMDRLADDLGAIERRHRRRAMQALALVGVGAGLWAWTRPPPDPCQGLEHRWDGVWDEARRGALPSSDASARFAERLDRYTRSWTAGYASACAAARDAPGRVRFNAQSLCFEQRWHQVEALVDAASKPEASAVRLDPLEVLDPIEPCGAIETAAGAAPDADAHALAARFAEVSGLRWEQRYDDAEQLAHEVVAAADATGFPRARAAARLELALVQLEIGEYEPAASTLSAAYWLAETAGDDALLAKTATPLIAILGSDLEHRERVAPWIERAQQAVARLGPRSRAAGSLHVELGGLAVAEGDLPLAKTEFTAALDILTSDGQPLTQTTAVVLQNLAIVHEGMGEQEEAWAMYHRALDQLQGEFGPSHPMVAMVQHNLGVFERGRDDPAAAVQRFELALAVKRQALPAAHRSTAMTLSELGAAQRELGQLDAAWQTLDEAESMLVETVGSDHPLTGAALAERGAVALARGRLDEAETLLERGIEVLRRTYGDAHRWVSIARIDHAELRAQQGLVDEARRELHEVRAALSRTSAEDDAELARVETMLAELPAGE